MTVMTWTADATWDDRDDHAADGQPGEHGTGLFTVEPDRPLDLTVDNPQGAVSVRAVARDDVLVRWRKHGRSWGRYADQVGLIMESDENRIRIRPEQPSGGFLGLARGWAGTGDLALDIEIPRRPAVLGPAGEAGTRLKVRTASAATSVADVAGAVSVATASGDVHLAGVTGDLSVTSASGDIAATGAAGHLAVRTASGDIQVEAGRLTGWSLSSASGDARIAATPAGAGPFQTQTVSGDVTLALRLPDAPDAPAAATVAFQSVSGDAEVRRPFRREDRRSWRLGPDGLPGPHLTAKTVSGDLEVTAALVPPDAVPSHAPDPAPDPTSGVATDFPPPPPSPPVANAGADHPVRAASVAPDAPTSPLPPPSPPAPPAVPAPPEPPIPLFAPADPPLGDADARIAPPTPPAPTPDVPPSAETTAADAAQEPQAPDDATRLEVLLALERGEIDIDEAMRQLDDLAP